MSSFKIQIVYGSNDVVVSWRPGSLIETELIETLSARMKRRGVGVFRSEASVLKVMREEFAEMLLELKKLVRP